MRSATTTGCGTRVTWTPAKARQAGAAVGAAKGRRAQKKAGKQAEAQAAETAKATDAASKDTFKKAWSACLERT